MADKYLSLEDALSVLGIEEEQFELLIANGEIKAFRTQGKVKFKDGDVQDLFDRLDSINLDSVIDDDELPDISESSEMLPAIELEELEDSDFTIELPDDVASGDPTQSSSSFALEDEDSLMVDVDDLDLDDDEIESPSDITIDADDLDLDLDLDEEDDLVTSDITIQEDAVNTSELTVQEDAVNTSELTIDDDSINTSELTVQEDAVNTSELTVNDDFGTEAGLSVDEDEVEEEDDEDDYEDSRRSSRRGSGRRSSRQAAYEKSRTPILWTVLLIIIILVQLWTVLSYYVPYYYYKMYENKVNVRNPVKVPPFLKSQVEWANKNFKPKNKNYPTPEPETTFEIFSEATGVDEAPEDGSAPDEDEEE